MIAAATGCGPKSADRNGADEADESARFANVSGSAEFVGDEACFDCHEQEYRGYQSHGMAQSFYPLTPENAVENYVDAERYHQGTDLYYRVVREGDRFYQEEIRRGEDGQAIHRLRREMEFVVGSGSAARTYLTEENGRLFELPLTWYTQRERWDFSPGYQHFNVRFDRLIPDRCMTCHNSYPEPVRFVEGKYERVPDGIGCERCHGPGSIHVDARLTSPEGVRDIDTTIVNPAHLSLERRLDVCQQCHLHTTVSVLREGRTAYDFRPSQKLAEYVGFFAADEESEGTIDVISHADRMQQSACFLQTQATAQPMDCVTCHNPHEGFREAGPDYFNATCKTCHNIETMEFAREQARAVHTEESNCFSCHMPKVEGEGTPHTTFTDHWIRVVEDAPQPEPARTTVRAVELDPYYDEDEGNPIYQGMAYIVYGRQRGDSTALRKGIRLLEENLQDREGFGEAYFLLGYAHLQDGSVEDAIPALETAVLRNSGVPERLNALAQAYEAADRPPAKIEQLYRRAVDIQPSHAEIRTNYGRFLESQNRLAEAVDQYRLAVEEHPWLETGHYNLGTAYLRTGDFDRAEAALREAITLDPDYDEALSNLGLLLAGRGRPDAARPFFERAVRAAPRSPAALGNLGAYHLNSGNLSEAISLLERAVTIDPRYVDGLVNLAIGYANTDRPARARDYAERALRLEPGNERARAVMQALQ